MPCNFCNKFSTKMSQHLLTVHKNESAVHDILKLTPKKKEFPFLHKLGVMEFIIIIKKILAGSDDIIPVRTSKQSSKGSMDFCEGCKGELSTKYFWSHKCPKRKMKGKLNITFIDRF